LKAEESDTAHASPGLPVGTQLHGYLIERVESLDYLGASYYELRHLATGARHIHIANNDDNNVFVVMLATPSEDSTGVAHILEHVVLSGSEHYPVRDVFFSMNPRSLRTFMNASTGSDSTQYYFSTRNQKDFFNLLSVYLDAVYFPRLLELSFRQEGHRLEFERPDDPESGLRFKGVVFNEMKGAMANPASIMFRATGKSLFPDLTYAYNSGGDPKDIPDLTWQGLRDFHRRHYHPSNSFFYTYGNLPIPTLLETISERVLDLFEAADIDASVPDQPRFSAPVTATDWYPVPEGQAESSGCQVLVTWLTTPSRDSFHVLAFEVLERVLLANAASPLRKALIDSGLGTSLTDLSGFMAFTRESAFGTGLKGVKPDDVERVEAVVLGTLERLVAEGIDPKAVDAAVHRLEIERREVTNSGLPYGLRLFERFESAYQHGGDPFRSLQFDEDLERLERERSEGTFFEDLIRTWMLTNKHRCRVVLAPDPGLEDKQLTDELARLAAIELGLSPQDKQQLVDWAVKLQTDQDRPQDLSVLPTLELADIPMAFEDVSHRIEEFGGVRIGLFPQPTNGLSYVDLAFDFSHLDERLIDLLGIFAHALTRSGAGADDYLKLATRAERFTGGIGAYASVRATLAGAERPYTMLTLSGKAIRRNLRPFIDILHDLVTGAWFEPNRLKDLLGQQRGGLEPRILQAGHQYAQKLAASRLAPLTQVDERISGLSLISRLRRLKEPTPEELEALVADLNAIRDSIFRNGAAPLVCITSDEAGLEAVKDMLGETFAAAGPSQPKPFSGAGLIVPGKHPARTTAAPVAYNAKVRRVVSFTHPDAPALMVLANYLDDKYLLREIREKGGAYGASAVFGREAGYFSLLSYRDPHIVRTHQVWKDAVPAVIDGLIDDQDLKEAILASCAAIDPLLSPDTKGRTRFFDDLAGYTLERKAEFKRGLLAVRIDDLRRVAQTYLSTEDGVSFATIGNPDMVVAANQELGDIFEIVPI
jgi:presequence protease